MKMKNILELEHLIRISWICGHLRGLQSILVHLLHFQFDKLNDNRHVILELEYLIRT